MAFTDEQIQRVWEKGREVEGYNKDKYRQDACGAWMEKNKYGDTSSPFGWEIDHIKPKALLEGQPEDKVDNIDNLRPLQWSNNRAKGDDFPWYATAVAAADNKNVKKLRFLKVNDIVLCKINSLFGGAGQ